DPMTAGMFTLIDGAWPESGEVAVSAALAERLAIDVGDRVHVDGIGSDRAVAAIIERPGQIADEFTLSPTAPRPARHVAWLVDTPSPITWQQVLTYNEIGLAVYSRHVAADPPPSPLAAYLARDDDGDIMLLSLIGFGVGLVVLEVVLLAGPAFTIGARRRTREFALLAANGATPAQIRRVVLAGGGVLGVVAAITAAGLGVGIAYLSLPATELLFGTRMAGFRINPQVTLSAAALVIVSGLLAALVPAYVVGRQPIVMGLAGRRGIGRSRRVWVVTGAALAVLGLTVAWFGAGRPSVPAMLLGVAIGELGLVLCTPALVGAIGRLGRVLPLSPRIALRDAARNRGSAAPAIAAVMAVVGVGIAVTMFATGEHARQNVPFDHGPAAGTAVVDLRLTGPTGMSVPGDDAVDSARELLRRHLPIDSLHNLEAVGCATTVDTVCALTALPPPDHRCPFDEQQLLTPDDQVAAAAHPGCTATVTAPVGRLAHQDFVIGVDDVAAVTGLRGSRLENARAVIADGGVIVPDSGLLSGDTVTIEIHDTTIAESIDAYTVRETAGFAAYANDGGAMAADQILFSTGAAERLGLRSEGSTVVGVPTRQPTTVEVDRLALAMRQAGLSGESRTATDGENLVVSTEHVPAPESSTVTIVLWFAGGVSAALALGATAVATALTAAESRRDLRTLAAIGASPGVRRRLSLFQAGVISTLGAVLGVITGVGVCVAAMAAMNSTYAGRYPRENLFDLGPPWLNIGAALIAVPLIAMLGAGLLTRSRLPIERRPS
ncbi:FtsX-like permease family protein, partial [Stackebrandtia soli]|uniref:FtsX-like permease family protein n=1 Tax=Stackebrandtia soli TaxID=1892856 RepID=UPI0039EB5318